MNGIVGASCGDVGRWLLREHGLVGLDERPVARGVDRWQIPRRHIDALGQRAQPFDSLQPVSPEHRDCHPASVGLEKDLLGIAQVSRHDKELNLRPGDSIEQGTDLGGIAEERKRDLDLATERAELVGERGPESPPIRVVDIENGAVAHAEVLAYPSRQGAAVRQVRRTKPKRVGSSLGHLRRRRARRNLDYRILATVVGGGGGDAGTGEAVADDGHHSRAIEVRRDHDRGVGVFVVVPQQDFDGATMDSAGLIDFEHGELCRKLHRRAAGVLEVPSDADGDWPTSATARREDARRRDQRMDPCWESGRGYRDQIVGHWLVPLPTPIDIGHDFSPERRRRRE